MCLIFHIPCFQFDKFRRDVIQMTFSSGFKQPENKELTEDDIVNYIRLLSEDRDFLTREIEDYKNSESEVIYQEYLSTILNFGFSLPISNITIKEAWEKL